MEFFAIFFGLYGLVAMALAMAVLVVLGVALSLEEALCYAALFAVVLVTVRVCWYWTCCGMSNWLRKGCWLQRWFENEFLDMKHPSRVRRRRNKIKKEKSGR